MVALWIILVIVVFVVLALILYFVTVYNGLITLKQNITKSRANIDVLLKQRFDELPKLVETVKGYMKHEKNVLTTITQARSLYNKATTMAQKAEADTMITGALKTLFAVAENYPKLEASKNFQQLQERISSIEHEIADRREFYNDSVNNFNIRIHSIPDVFVAKMLSYVKDEEPFKAAEAEKQDIKIKF